MIPVGTLLCGFTFEGTVEMDLLPPESLEAYGKKRFAVGSFHIWAAITLACSVYAVAVSCVAIVLGQRLAIQATADQTVKHEQNIRELNAKFKGGLFACALALVGVLGCALLARKPSCPPLSFTSFSCDPAPGCLVDARRPPLPPVPVPATLCAIWVTSETIYSIIASCIVFLVIPGTSWGCWTLNARLNDRMDEGSTLHLKTSKDAMGALACTVHTTAPRLHPPHPLAVSVALGPTARPDSRTPMAVVLVRPLDVQTFPSSVSATRRASQARRTSMRPWARRRSRPTALTGPQ
eukprot:7381447-Prymnesium_polylepis.1